MKPKLQIAAIKFSQCCALRLMKLALFIRHWEYMSVTIENVGPAANISICSGQQGVLIVLILYKFSILQNVRSLPTWHLKRQVVIICMNGCMVVY